MNAKELRDAIHRGDIFFAPTRGFLDYDERSSCTATILRALDLLDRVEESEDELVRELREQHCRDFGSDPQCNMDNLCICDMHERAAAALVALKAERESMKEQFESLIAQGQAKMDALKAERDKFRGHAEAMATELNGYIGLAHPALDAYRRDFPKDAP